MYFEKKGEIGLLLVLITVIASLGFLALFFGDFSLTGAAVFGDNSSADCGRYVQNTSTLIGNITACISDGLIINASNMELNCQGFSIRGTQGGGTSAININNAVQNASIINCDLRNFTTGIVVGAGWNVTNTIIMNMSADSININQVSNVHINQTTITSSGSDGIYLVNVNSTLSANITNSTITGSTSFDINIDEGSSGSWKAYIFNNQIGGKFFAQSLFTNASASQTYIYNNNFTGTNNINSSSQDIQWNTSIANGTNIMNGPTMGGNFFPNYGGNDTGDDGIGDDTTYTINGSASNKDRLPLVRVYQYTSPTGAFESSVSANSTFNITNRMLGGSNHSTRQNITFVNWTSGRRYLTLDAYFNNMSVDLTSLTIPSNDSAIATKLSSSTGFNSTHRLYLNNSNNRNAVVVCPDATSLAGVSVSCSNNIRFTSQNITDGAYVGGIRITVEGTEYVIENLTGTGATLGSNATLRIWDESETDGSLHSGKTRNTGNTTIFFANYSDTNNSGILNANCTTFYHDNARANMSFNSTSGLYQANRTYSSSKNYDWNVTCIRQYYDTLTAIDTVAITPKVPCGYVNTNATMEESVNASGTCFTINATGLTLNCAGYQVNYSVSGSSASNAVNNTRGFFNVTVKNCNAREANASFNNQYAFIIFNSTNSSISNSTITTIGNYSYGIFLNASTRTNVSGNRIITSGASASALVLEDTNTSIFHQDNATTNGTNASGVYIYDKSSTNEFLNLTVNTSSIAVYTFNDETGTTTNNTLFYNNTFGSINWTKSNLTTNITLQLGLTIYLENNLTGLTENAQTLNLNGTASIQIRNLTFGATPNLLKNGVRCDDTNACNLSYDIAGGVLSANISSFSNYSTADVVVPNVTSLLPAVNSVFNLTNTFQLAANVSDNIRVHTVLANVSMPNGTIKQLTLTNRSDYSLTFNTTFTDTNVTGVYNITIIANDTSNNRNTTQTSNFTVNDVINPSVNNLVPALNTAFNLSNTITFATNVTDNYNVSRVFVNITAPNNTIKELELDYRSGDQYNNTFAVPNLTGAYNITFIANDSPNNRNTTQTSNFTVNDMINPSVNNLVPALNTAFNLSNTITFAINVTDNYNVSRVFVNITAPNTTIKELELAYRSGDQYNNTFAAPNVTGAYNVTFIANDSSNNRNTTQTSNFTVNDVVNPSVNNLMPALNTAFNLTNTITFAANVTDNYNVSRVFVNITAPNNTIKELELAYRSDHQYNNTFTSTNLTGAYNVTFIANDSSNNRNTTQSSNFTVNDVINPSVNNLVPVVNTVFSVSSTITFAANVTDNYNVSRVFVNITAPNTTIKELELAYRSGDQYNNTFIAPSLTGRYNITFITNDSSNNRNTTQTSNFTVDIDVVNPSVDNLIPVASSVFTVNAQITFSADVTDDVNVSRVFVNLSIPNGTNDRVELTFYTANQYNIAYTRSATTGVYNLTFIANDSNNNINSTRTSNFTVQVPSPEDGGSGGTSSSSTSTTATPTPTANPAPAPAIPVKTFVPVQEATPDEIKQFLQIDIKDSRAREQISLDNLGKIKLTVPITFSNIGTKSIRVQPTIAERFTALNRDAVAAAIQREQPLLSMEEIEKKAEQVQRVEEQKVQFLVGKVSTITGFATIFPKAFSNAGLATALPKTSSTTESTTSSVNTPYSCGLTPSGNQITGKLLQPELLNAEEIIILPGQVVEKNFEVLAGPSIIPVVPLDLVSQHEIVAEREINTAGKVPITGFIEVDKNTQTLELYYFLPAGTSPGPYVFEVSIESSGSLIDTPKVPAKFFLPYKFLQPSIRRTLCADTFGPYAGAPPGVIFAQQFTYDAALYHGDYVITTTISSGSTTITENHYPVQL